MRRHPMLILLLLTSTLLLASDADVFRLNYRKSAAAKSQVKPATSSSNTPHTMRKGSVPSAFFTASTRLGTR